MPRQDMMMCLYLQKIDTYKFSVTTRLARAGYTVSKYPGNYSAVAS